MRLKITLSKNIATTPVTCVGWNNTEEVYTAGDDNRILSWSVSNNQSTEVAHLPRDVFPVDLHFIPRVTNSVKQADLVLITCADGKFHMANRSGRIERTVEAHKGAVLVGQWDNDGTGLLTAGEDGCVKIWSRSGMLRSLVVSSDSSIYGAAWAPDNQSIAYTQGKLVVVKSLTPNTKPLKWKAHEGLVLCLAWSNVTEYLVTGGEDCKYKVWNSQGRLLFSSGVHDNHITCVAWSPNGELLAVASFNTIRLCDYSGWSCYLEKPNTGCIYKMCWSGDGTQLAGACANGRVFFAHVIERRSHYKSYTATLTDRKLITVRNSCEDTVEHLELPNRVIHMQMKYDHLVVTTPNQCHIYSTTNWNTPAIFDLKTGFVNLLMLSEKNLLLVEKSNVGLYNLQGRLVASPRWPNMRLDCLKPMQIALSAEYLAVRDFADHKVVHVIDLNNVKNNTDSLFSIKHSTSVIQIGLDRSERNVAVLDKSKDLYVIPFKNNTYNKEYYKMGRKIESFKWNTEGDILAAIQDTNLMVWYCPSASFNSGLLKLTTTLYDTLELGGNPRINDFIVNSVSVRRADGALLNTMINPFPLVLHRYVHENKWTEALDLCRANKEQLLWACLAVLATQSQSNNDLMDIAEEAYANINHYAKVLYIQNIKKKTSKLLQKAHLCLLGGGLQEPEAILLYHGLIFHAIYINIQMFRWNRALDLAKKHTTHLDTVVYLRRKYLKDLKKDELDKDFLELNETMKIDEEKIKEKIALELNKG